MTTHDYRWLPMAVQWLSDDCPMTIRCLFDDYPMTIWWLSRAFDLFFLIIIDLKRSIDRRWLLKSGATFILILGGGPFQKNKSYPHFLMLWSLYNRYLTLKIVSLQNQVPVRPNHFFRFSAKIGHLRGFPTFSQMLLWSPKYLFLSLLIKSNVASHIT